MMCCAWEPLERRTLLSGTISGIVFDDLNGNGRREEGEPGLADQVVFLDTNFDGEFDKSEPKQITDSTGAYSFEGIDNGVVRVRHLLPEGRRLTAPASIYFDVAVTPTTREVAPSFGNTDTAVIRGTVFIDLDNDTLRGVGEPGLEGWTVFLDKDNDGVHDSNEKVRVTNSAGDYRFTGLTPGVYRVRILQQDQWVRTVPTIGFWIVGVTNAQSVSNRNFGQSDPDLQHLTP